MAAISEATVSRQGSYTESASAVGGPAFLPITTCAGVSRPTSLCDGDITFLRDKPRRDRVPVRTIRGAGGDEALERYAGFRRVNGGTLCNPADAGIMQAHDGRRVSQGSRHAE